MNNFQDKNTAQSGTEEGNGEKMALEAQPEDTH